MGRNERVVKWTYAEIAIALARRHPDKDPKAVNFVDLYKWVMALPGFSDDPNAAASASSGRFSRRGSRKPSESQQGLKVLFQTPFRSGTVLPAGR